MPNMKKPATPRKPAIKRPGVKPAPLGTAPKAPRRGNAKPAPLGTPPAKPKGRITPMPKTTKKAPSKKKVEVMPDKINPFKMTPAQKARYLKNPERYDY
jgi:hypothetical protein